MPPIVTTATPWTLAFALCLLGGSVLAETPTPPAGTDATLDAVAPPVEVPQADSHVDDYADGHGPRPSFGPPTGEYEHDGFYLRFNLGASYLQAAYSLRGQRSTYSGPGPTFGGAIGSVVWHRLIVFGEAQAIIAVPRLEIAGQSQAIDQHNLVSFSIGPGVAYYVDSLGLLFSGTLAVTQLQIRAVTGASDEGSSVDLTNLGIGTNLQLGKEWWIDLDWGLGVIAQLHLATAKLKNEDARMTTVAYSLLFSATYN